MPSGHGLFLCYHAIAANSKKNARYHKLVTGVIDATTSGV